MNCYFLCVFYSLLILVVFSVVFRCYVQRLLYMMILATDPFNSNENVHHDNEARRETMLSCYMAFVYIYKRYYFSELYVMLVLYEIQGALMTGGLRYDLLRKEISLDMYWYFVFSNKEERKLNVITCTNFLQLFHSKANHVLYFSEKTSKTFFYCTHATMHF